MTLTMQTDTETHSRVPSGRSVRVLAVTSQLPENGKSVDMAPLVRQLASLREVGADVEVLQVKGVKWLKYPMSLLALRKLAARADIIHAHYTFCGWLARAQLSRPVVCSFMGDDLLGTPDAQGKVRPTSKLIIRGSRLVSRLVDAVIVKSAEMAEVVSPVNAHIIPNGVDMEAFAPIDKAEAKARLGWKDGQRFILFPGNPDNPRKGFDLARQAVEEARSRIADPLKIVVLWNVEPALVPIYMNACDAMFMTSWIEGSPNVVKEAMACNLPVIAVPVGDVVELLEDVAGYAIAPRDPAALAEKLVQTLTTCRPAEGRSALLRKQLDSKSVAQRIMDIYTEVLTRKKSLPATEAVTSH